MKFTVGIAALALALTTSAGAQDFPTKPIRIVSPFTPGTGADLLARTMAPFLEERLKQPVIVENRPGAGGQIGNAYVARSTPDGYTLLIGSQTIGMQKYLIKNLGFDPDKDLTPVYKLVALKIVLATNVEVPAKTLGEFANYAKQNPGKVFYGGLGPTGVVDMSLEMVNRDFGMGITPVQYQGPPQYVTALLRNEVQLTWGSMGVIKQHVEANKLRILAAVSHERLADMPSLPTLRESGYKGFVPVTWLGIFAPAGTPKPVLDRLGREFAAVLQDPQVRAKLNDSLGLMPLQSSPESFSKEYTEEMKVWAAAFKASNVVPQ